MGAAAGGCRRAGRCWPGGHGDNLEDRNREEINLIRTSQEQITPIIEGKVCGRTAWAGAAPLGVRDDELALINICIWLIFMPLCVQGERARGGVVGGGGD